MSIHQPAARPPSGRRTPQPKRVTASVLASGLLVAALAPLAAQPANAELVSYAPVTANDADGFPDWYSDGTVRLKLCVDPAEGCLAELPNPDAPISYPTNFPGEAFWFMAEASGGNLGLYEAALEAAHTGEEAATGTQIAFARLRFRMTGLTNGASYTITHPYGVNTFVAVEGGINVTLDEGVCGTPCDFDSARRAFLGNFAGTTATTAAFFRQTNAPAGTLGNPNSAGPITGAPSGNNFVEVVGPNAGGPGVNVLRVNNFAVQGVIDTSVDGAPSVPDLAAAGDSGRSSTDNITNAATPSFTGTAAVGSTVELVIDGAPTGITAVAADGTYTLAPTALAEGTRRVSVKTPATATTPELASAALTVTVDRTAPVATLTSTPSNPSADTTPAFSFTSEAQATFECQLLASNATWRTCSSPHTYDQQLANSYTFNTRATDVAGNVGANASYSWRIGAATPPASKQKDMNNDGRNDLIGRDSSGRLWFYAGNGARGYSTRTLMGSGGWNSMNAILMPGDFDGDKKSDLIARDTLGRLWLYPGSGTGALGTRTQIGSSWNNMTAVASPGDFNGDAKVDLLARDSSGRLWLYPGDGAGGFLTRTLSGSGGWNSMNAIVGVGDFNSDGKADFHARDAEGRLWLYPGTGAGGHGVRSLIGTGGWNSMTALVGTGTFDANTTPDLVARDTGGRLWLYPGSGTGSLQPRVQIGTNWQIYTLLAP